ncbi:MAG: hypothetical protein KJ000_18140 [Pirellulaceae bacterium]|nr:hypothetical protein [Pirellulaceae bacterium]
MWRRIAMCGLAALAVVVHPAFGQERAGSSGVVASAELIHWKARSSALDYAAFVDPIWLSPGRIESLDFDWQTGVRGRLGYRFDSAWDVGWSFTYYDTEAAGSVDWLDEPDLALVATRSVLDITVDAVAATASLNYQVHDLEIGRNLCLRDDTDLRLFGGFRWAQIDQAAATQYEYSDFLGDTFAGELTSRSELEAYGIRIGAEGWWNLPRGFSLFGRAAGSVLAGRFKLAQQEIDDVEGTVVDFTGTIDQAVPVLETAAGAAWTYGNWQVAGGYELASWFNLAAGPDASHDLLLDGFFVRVSYAR